MLKIRLWNPYHTVHTWNETEKRTNKSNYKSDRFQIDFKWKWKLSYQKKKWKRQIFSWIPLKGPINPELQSWHFCICSVDFYVSIVCNVPFVLNVTTERRKNSLRCHSLKFSVPFRKALALSLSQTLNRKLFIFLAVKWSDNNLKLKNRSRGNQRPIENMAWHTEDFKIPAHRVMKNISINWQRVSLLRVSVNGSGQGCQRRRLYVNAKFLHQMNSQSANNKRNVDDINENI